MLRTALLFVLIACVAVGAACTRKRTPGDVGGLYYFENERNGYSVLKVLTRDDLGIHVRVYSNNFATPPANVDPATLYIASMENRKLDDGVGAGHMAVSHASFSDWRAVHFQTATVTDEELEGYRAWLQSGGGYF